ncbi:MAG: SGNH/GDSL hydrolase family protein [Anaerolineaceae bacterium]|nr:SGNH/GDSL hydrolase family protein [Anaerolineaceae bacterium]
MRHKTYFRFVIFLTIISMALTGCSQSKVIEAREVIEMNNIEEWDLLWISDSIGWGVAEVYASYVSEDLGIKINLNDQRMPGLSAGKVLNLLKGGSYTNLDLMNIADYIAEAEIIVFYGNPERSVDPDNPGDWICGESPVNQCYVTNCEMDTFDLYIDHVKEIYGIIKTIRKGTPTMIRAYDSYNPRLVSQCLPGGTFDECRACWENYSKAIHIAAEEMGVPVANVFDAWNGVDHTENPVDKGYVRDDGEHPNEKGAEVIASVLRDLGYEMTIP